MALLHRCLAAPSEVAADSALQEACGVPPNAERFGPALHAVQVERLFAPATWRPGSPSKRRCGRPARNSCAGRDIRSATFALIVLSHGPLPRRPGETPVPRDAQNRVRTGLHEDIAHSSTRSTLRTIVDAGHFFQLDQPQEVAAAVLEIVDAARAQPATSAAARRRNMP